MLGLVPSWPEEKRGERRAVKMGVQVKPRTQRSKKGGREPKAILPSRPGFAAQPPGELEQVTS